MCLMITMAPVCSIILLYDRISVVLAKSCFNLQNFHATLFIWCLFKSRYVFILFSGSPSWILDSVLQFRFSFLVLSFLVDRIMKGQCMTEYISLQKNITCKIKADNHWAKKHGAGVQTIHVSTRASVMTWWATAVLR